MKSLKQFSYLMNFIILARDSTTFGRSFMLEHTYCKSLQTKACPCVRLHVVLQHTNHRVHLLIIPQGLVMLGRLCSANKDEAQPPLMHRDGPQQTLKQRDGP